MSRTYRRKGFNQGVSRYLKTQFSLYGVAQTYWEPPPHEEMIKKDRLFHSDKRNSCCGPADKEYRKIYVRRDRRRQKNSLERAFKEGIESLDSVIVEHRHRHSATYDYW